LTHVVVHVEVEPGGRVLLTARINRDFEFVVADARHVGSWECSTGKARNWVAIGRLFDLQGQDQSSAR